MGSARAMRQGWRPAAGIGAAAALVLLTGVAEPVRRDLGDVLLRLASARPPAHPPGVPDVTIVAIDPQSLRAFPDWPWPRSRYADLVERLDAAGARAIAFDIDFSTPRDPQDDAHFARVIARSGRVALAAFRQVQDVPGGAELEIANLPIPSLAENAAALGSVLVPVDPDGAVRRMSLTTEIGGRPIPSLAGAALALAQRQRASAAPPGELVLVDYRRLAPSIPLLSVVDVLEGRIDPRDVAGRVAFVGATAVEFQDLWTTPMGPAQPGVLIQALVLRTLAAREVGQASLRLVPVAVEIALVLILSTLASALVSLSHARRVAGLLLLAAAAALGSLLALRAGGWLLAPVVPLGVVGGHYVIGLEAVRRRFGRRLAERELSLGALFRVGQATADAPSAGPGGLDLALALLGDVVGASGAAFLRVGPDGALDGRRLEWSRLPGRPVGDPDTARRVLEGGDLRIFEGEIPGPAGRPGLAVYVPLRAGGAPVGVLAVERELPAPLDETALRTVATVGAQLALSARNLQLIDDLHATFDTSISAMASAIEARDGYTESHCRRLAAFSSAMAVRLDLDQAEVEAIRLGALLHDVGKIGVPDQVLLKVGRYTPEERRQMERHAEVGWRILAPIHGISPTALAIVRHHHERWDGRGYPARLAGAAIPLGARLVTIVDVWDALSTQRPYKPAYPQDRVRAILEKGRGELFDPELLDLFFGVLDEEGDEMLATIDGSGEGRSS